MLKISLKIIVPLLIITALFGFSACNSDSSLTNKQSNTSTIYTVADSTGDWGYPSPYTHYSRGPGYVRMQFVFETLVWKNDSEFIPQLSNEWQYNEDENSYTFKLRQDVKWHDGTEFTAEDVVFTYHYVKNHPYQWVDSSIVESAEALDNYTVKLYLSRTYAPFLQDVAGTQPILPKHIWEVVTEPDMFTSPEAVIGTGPYRLLDYSKEHGTYLYEANEGYYGGQPLADELKFIKISEQMMSAALQEGSVNYAPVQGEVVELLEEKGFAIINDQPSWNGKLTINHLKEPLSNREFRQALAYAIDRESLVQIVFRRHASAGSAGMMPPTSDWYNPDIPQYEYDPAKARELISGLGYELKDGYFVKEGQTLKLELIAAADYKELGIFIAQQLEQAGIKIEFRTLEAKTVDSRVSSWEFDLSIYGHGGLYEPSIFYKVVLDDGFNSARFDANSELKELIENQLTEMDTNTRRDMIDEIQKLYAEEVPALTLYYPKSYTAHDGSIPLYYTMNGIGSGVPLPLNRMCFAGQE